MNKSMLYDTRVIEALWLPNQDNPTWVLGKGGVDKIEVYGEVGQEAYVPWFALWRNGKIWMRVNAAAIETVVYDYEDK